MADKPKPKTRRGRFKLEDLSPGEVRVLENHFGVVLTPGWEAQPETREEHLACAFCGRTDGGFRQLFDREHNITICLVCLESVEED